MDDEAYARRYRLGFRIGIAALAVIVAAPIAWILYSRHEDEPAPEPGLTASERAELGRQIPALRAAITRAETAFVEDVTVAAINASATTEAPCPVHLRGLDGKYAAYGPVGKMQVVAVGQAPGPEGVKAIAAELDALTRETPTKSQLAHLREVEGQLEQILFLVGERTQPIVMGDSYQPGRIHGVAMVYSATARKIVCAAPVDVSNPSEIEVAYRQTDLDRSGESHKREAADSKLAHDLAARAGKAIAKNLRATK